MQPHAQTGWPNLRLLAASFWICIFCVVTASAQTSEVVTYYHADAIGSIRMVTDANGQIVERHDYMPFGEEWQAPASHGERRLFAGQERDAETSFDYFGARYYASSNGRFTNVDPGHVNGDIYDPQSWNAYAYARSNPLRFIDPFGFGECPASSDTSTCVEGDKWVTGQFTIDYFRFLTVSLASDYWQWRTTSDNGVMTGSPLMPPVFKEERLIGLGLRTAAESNALTTFWPPANGFLGGLSVRTTLKAGTKIDRYGASLAARFFSPVGTPLAARSLPPGAAGQGLRSFEVIEPFEVDAGRTAPWFGQSGLGVQYRSVMPLDELLRRGFLREIRP
jgi:RHS repeat-associated protein